MLKKLTVKIIFVTFLSVSATTFIIGQEDKTEDKLEYTLKNVDIETGSKIIVSLGSEIQSGDASLLNPANWTVKRTGIDGNETVCVPTSVQKISIPSTAGNYIRLDGCFVDLSRQKVTARFLQFPPSKIDVEEDNFILVSFGTKSKPGEETLNNRDNWLVRTIDIDGNEKDCKPSSAKKDDTPGTRITYTRLDGCRVDLSNQKVLVRFLQANHPEIITTQPKKEEKGFFAEAEDKDDADFYFSGFVKATKGGKPAYAVETKVNYLRDIGRYGDIGVKATADIAEDSNFDPDSIKLTGSYQKVFAFKRATGTGVILNSDFFGGEFDRKNETRNIATGVDLVWVFPSKGWKDRFATIDFTTGFEGGHNFKSKLAPEGFGNYGRLKVGTAIYFTDLNPFLFQRIDFTANYTARLLSKAEPFTENEVDFLTRKTRHYAESDLDFMFSKYLGFSIKYRYGSLPPAFKFVDHNVSFGLTLKAKQAK